MVRPTRRSDHRHVAHVDRAGLPDRASGCDPTQRDHCDRAAPKKTLAWANVCPSYRTRSASQGFAALLGAWVWCMCRDWRCLPSEVGRGVAKALAGEEALKGWGVVWRVMWKRMRGVAMADQLWQTGQLCSPTPGHPPSCRVRRTSPPTWTPP